MRRRLAVLLVDALGASLAGATPGFGAALPHRRTLRTILGFSSGALPTLFTGRGPQEHGRWLMYRRVRAGTPFLGFGALALLPRRVRESWRLGQLLSRWVRARGVRGYFSLYRVPRALLAELDLAEHADVFAPGGLPGGAIWDTVERAGTRWRSWNWRTPETDALAAMERALESGPEDFLFCYTAALDDALHREGSRGAGVRERMERYDGFLSRAASGAERRGEDLRLVLLSDHGMVDVRGCVDVMGALAGLRCHWPRDYIPFFDATFARFWWRSPAARDEVRAALGGLAGGRWLDDATLEAEGVRFPGHDYGDDVFLLDPGRLIVPSFMGDQPLAGMHGYDPGHPDMHALLWSNAPVPDGVRRLQDVRAHLEAALAWLGEGR
jgi:hypothetical protein